MGSVGGHIECKNKTNFWINKQCMIEDFEEKVPYTKRPLSIKTQVAKLEKRGLIIVDCIKYQRTQTPVETI